MFGSKLASVVLAAAMAAEPGGLPSIDCVRSMRASRLAEQRGEITVAAEELRSAIEACPEHLAMRVELLRLYERHSMAAEEVVRLRAEVTGWVADPERPLPEGTLGWLLRNPELGADEKRAVLGAIRARRAAFPDDVELLETAAGLHLALDERAEARELYGRLLELRPGDTSLRWTCIELDRELERWSSAIALVEPLVGGKDEPPGVALTYAELLGRTGQHERMVERLDALTARLGPAASTDLRPALYQVLRDTAWHLWDEGKREASERIFRRLLEIDRADPEALSAVRYLFGDPHEIAEREAALAERWADEDDPQALLDRGSSLLAAGDAAGAIDPLRRAAEALPASEPAWFNLGLAASRFEDWPLAERAFARAAEINPARAQAQVNRAAALEKLGRCPEALVLLEAALAAEPEMHEAWYYSYLCHRAAGDVKAASEALSRYEALRPPPGP